MLDQEHCDRLASSVMDSEHDPVAAYHRIAASAAGTIRATGGRTADIYRGVEAEALLEAVFTQSMAASWGLTASEMLQVAARVADRAA